MSATVMVASHRHELGRQAMLGLEKYSPQIVDGTGAVSCSAVWNQCIVRCPTPVVIICNEKARPHPDHVDELLCLLAQGYGFVGLYRFGFFGFWKHLISEIGWFDERYIGGWHEDNDTILRLGEADIAYYESEVVPYVQMRSAWSHDEASVHWKAKWKLVNGYYQRQMSEPEYSYSLGDYTDREYLPWSHSELLKMSGGNLNRKMVRYD